MKAPSNFPPLFLIDKELTLDIDGEVGATGNICYQAFVTIPRLFKLRHASILMRCHCKQ